MIPLADRSVNRQSRIPIAGLEPRSRINNENMPPGSNPSRLLAPTKSSISRSRSPSPSPIPLPITPRTASANPGRGHLSTVTSNDSLNATFARRQSLHRPSATSLVNDMGSRTPKSPAKSTRRLFRQSRPSSPVAGTKEPHGRVSEAGVTDRKLPLLTGELLPSRPVTTLTDSMSPTKDLRDTLEASTHPPLKAPSTSHEEEGSSSSQECPVTRRGSAVSNMTPSAKHKSPSKLPRSSVHNSPAIVSPILASLSTNLSSPHIASPVSLLDVSNRTDDGQPMLSPTCVDSDGHHPPRSSSLRTAEPRSHDVGLGIGSTIAENSSVESQERRYLPAVHSFSRPRAQQADRSPASAISLHGPQHSICADSPKLVTSARSPKSTPMIVRSSPSLISRSPVANDILTFASRRLGNPGDFAALDHGSARSSKRRDDSVKTSPPKNANLALHDLPPRVPSPSEQNKLSPIRLIFGDKESASDDVFEYSRVKQLSGSLLSSSFIGSTLSISEEADHLILGAEGSRTPSFTSQTSLTALVDTEFDLPSPSENGFHVSWPADFGFNTADSGLESPTVQSSPSVRPKAFSRISEQSEESATGPDVEPDQHENQPPETLHRNEDTGLGDESKREDITTTLSILEGASAKENTSSKSVKKRLSAAKLTQTTSKDGVQDPVRTRNDRLPSYMLPTPASEARKNSTVPPPEVRRNNTSQRLTPNSNTRRASQATRVTPTPDAEKGRISSSDRHTPASELCGTTRSGRSTPTSAIPRSVTPTARPKIDSQVPGQTAATSKINSKTEVSSNQRASIGHIKISRQSPQPIETSRDGTFPPTRPRSESKGKTVLNNLKGLFSGKRDAPSTPNSGGRRFSIGSRKSVSMEADIPDVPAMPSVPAVPALPDSRRRSTTKSILVKKTATEEVQPFNPESLKEPSTLPISRRKSIMKDTPTKKDVAEEEKPSLRRKASKSKVATTSLSQEAESEKEKRDTVALMEMGLTLRQEASKEDNLVRKERMTSFAQVMLDTVTNAVEAERNMYAAMQAAEQAKMSYMMTQQSVQEMNKLVSTSRRLPLFKKKKRPDNNV